MIPFILSYCVGGLLTQSGNICTLDPPNPTPIKYYEAGKSCYVNGVFYSKCEDRLKTE